MTHQKLVAESLAAVLVFLPHKLRELLHRHQGAGDGRETHPPRALRLPAPSTRLGGHVERDLALYGANTVADRVAISAWSRTEQRKKHSEYTDSPP